MSEAALRTRDSPSPPAKAAPRPRESGLRPDIQGLRALAVISVLLYHLWPTRLTGGYVGVDVFFVISGFLITSHLLREADAGGIGIARFWARRAKRLLPASLLVLALTSIAILIWVPRTLWNQFLAEVAASTLYVQNWLLGFNSVDYLAAENVASPVQHFWTLSVEEQFYIVLPLVLIGVVGLAKWRRWQTRRTALIVIAAITIASFGYSVWLTHWAAGPAYFSTLTRAWEFGVGALIVALPALRGTVARTVVSLAGLAAILVAVVAFNAETPFPGYAAALPVLGTAAVIWAGSRTFADALGAFAPVAFVGGVSYAVYLWHWPPIILLPYITGHPLTTIEKVAIICGTLVIAWVSTTQWENRIRFSPRLLGTARPRVVAAWMAGAMALVLVIPVTTTVIGEQQSARRGEVLAELQESAPACFGAATMAEPGCENPALDGVLVPDPADISKDDDNRSECWSRGDRDFRSCTLGPSKGYDKWLLAVGDSHNNTLIGAYEAIAEANNWRIDVAGRGGCYWSDAPLFQKSAELEGTCAEWRLDLADFIAAHPDVDAIITTKSRRPLHAEVNAPAGSDPLDVVIDGMSDAWSSRPDPRIPVIAIVDNPSLPSTTATCVEQAQDEAAVACGVPRDAAFPPDGIAAAASKAVNAHVVDLSDLYCTEDVCPAVIGHVIVYRDGRHLTATYARSIAPYLGSAIAEIIEPED